MRLAFEAQMTDVHQVGALRRRRGSHMSPSSGYRSLPTLTLRASTPTPHLKDLLVELLLRRRKPTVSITTTATSS